MAEPEFRRLPRDARIELVADSTVLTAIEQEHVEAIWQAELRRRGRTLFNGELLEFVRLDGDRIVARFVEYKLYLAGLAGALATRGAVMPLGVSGIVQCGASVGFGRRSIHVTQYPGWLELFPSGGIDRNALRPDGTVDHQEQAIRELVEETGVRHGAVGGITTVALVSDPDGHVCDLCVSIELTEVEPTRLGPMRSEEYDELFFVSRGALPDLMLRCGGRIVPTSRTILTGLGWL